MAILKYQKQWFSLRATTLTLVRLREKVPIIPPEITIAVTTNTFLFAGYSLADWNFRVLEQYDATSIGLSFILVVVAVIFCA